MRWLASASASGSKRAVRPVGGRPTITAAPPMASAAIACLGRLDPADRVEDVVEVAQLGASVDRCRWRRRARATSSLAGLVSQATIAGRARQPRALDDREPDAAAADHRDGRARRHRRGVADGADAGGDRAADDRHDVERRVVADLDRTRPRDHDPLGERRHAEVVVQAVAPARACRRTARRCAATTFADELALPRPPGHALAARAALRHPREDHVVADREVVDALADAP